MKPLDAMGVSLQGTNLIEASAGTGKTYAITTLYLRCLLESQARVENLLVVTYTRAATSELRDRIRERIGQAIAALHAGQSKDATLQALIEKRIATGSIETDKKRLTLALRSFDQASIFTIHSFCQRCLTDSAFESGASFDSEFESDDKALADEIAEDFWVKEMYAIDPAEFVYLKDSGFGLSEVRQLCRKAIADPDLVILPPLGDLVRIDLTSFREAYQRLRECWQDGHLEIAKLLQAKQSQLHQTTFKANQIEGYLLAADLFLAPAQARPLDAKNNLVRLSGSYIATKVKKNKAAPEHPFFDLIDTYLAQCEEVRGHFVDIALRIKLALVDYARSESRKRKDQEQVLSFDDLLLRLRGALRGPGGPALAQTIKSRYPIALIDEFQDTDPVQYEVFRRIYDGASKEGSALFLIGDPKQAIYGFRGADLFTYFEARRDASDRAHTLDTNYRSSPLMVDAINRLFSGVKDSFLFADLQFGPVSPSPTAENLLVDDETDSCALEILLLERQSPAPSSVKRARRESTARVAGEITRLLTHGNATIGGRPVRPGDVAVLVRENQQARAMQNALRALGVPSVLESSDSVFVSDEALEVERVLAAMVEPRNRNAVKSALATSLLGYSGNDVFALQEDEAAWDAILVRFARWHATWTTRGFIQAFSQMLSDQEVGKRLLEHLDGQRKMTNLGQLGELLQKRALDGGTGPQVLVTWLHTMRVDIEARSAVGEAAQLRLESDADAVKIVTVHKSKGLEYNIVFCPFVWDGNLQRKADKKWVRFHDQEDAHRLKLDIGSADRDEHLAQSAREALAEDLRLLYVALTRAKHRCVTVCGAIKSFGASGLAYLLLRDEDLSTDSASLHAFALKVEALEDDELASALRTRIGESGRSIRVRALPTHTGQVFEAEIVDSQSLQARTIRRPLMQHWRTSSYSSLTRNADAEHDHDAHSNDAVSTDESQEQGAPILLANFPKGAHPGQMLHDIFEHLDFWQARPELIDTQVRTSLSTFGFDADRYGNLLARAFAKVLRTPLAETGFCLADVPASQRLSELEFQFPVCEGGSGLSAAALAKALSLRSSAPWPEHYLDSVKNLAFRPLSGFLKGFIDMVFVHNERWYLVDYKSNFLGTQNADYQRPAMARSMAEHHYFLQYHLYLVALDRYLRLRLPGYDYQTHMGGALYLFVRGMDPDCRGADLGAGVFFDLPSSEELALLDRALITVGAT